MLEFSRRVQRRIHEVTLEAFLDDDDLQDMVLYAIGQVGENANAVSDNIREAHPDLLWNALIGIRNRVFHSYGDIDMTLVYEAAVDHAPLLIQQLEKIIF
jgi:uncharacterized protein with HEPN domain